MASNACDIKLYEHTYIILHNGTTDNGKIKMNVSWHTHEAFAFLIEEKKNEEKRVEFNGFEDATLTPISSSRSIHDNIQQVNILCNIKYIQCK